MAKLAFLGCGTMGEILASGIAARGNVEPAEITITDRRAGRAAELSEKYGFEAGLSNLEAAESAETLILAVKPADMAGLLEEIMPAVDDRRLVISIAAGITSAFLESRLGSGARVVRAMPNVSSKVGEGMTAISAGSYAESADLDRAKALFAAVGQVVKLEEGLLDAVTAVSGSGPAYFALFAESMIEAATEMGLSHQDASELTVQTMLGTARLLRASGMSAGELRRAVTSPGGTTEAALRQLDSAGFPELVKAAIRAAAERAKQLSQ